jgi:hypothetical protein
VQGYRACTIHPTSKALLKRSDEEAGMARCEVCGNDYDKSFEIRAGGSSHVFDSFECAIHKMAPTCAHCHCRIVGHGVEAGGSMYCCASCARHSGVTNVADRA